jgi:hypothetical protein
MVMRKELRFESSAGVALQGISVGQKILAGVVSVAVTGLLIILPTIV